MTDAASLLITIDSRQVKAGQFDLEQLAAAGARAETSVGKMGRTSAAAGAQVHTASQAAAQMAAQVQKMVNGAMGSAAGISAVASSSKLAGYHLQNLAFQLQDVAVGLASGQRPLTVLMQQGTQMGGIMMQAGLGVKGLATEVARMTGIIKVSIDETLAADAAAAASAAKMIASSAARATANIAAADTELALAAADVRTAATSDVLAAAQARLAAAHEAVALAAREAAVAENALAQAEGRASVAREAANATRAVSIGRVGAAVARALPALGLFAGAFATLNHDLNQSAGLKEYAKSLGLTHNEMKKLKDMHVTFGDVAKGTWKTIGDLIGVDLTKKVSEAKEAFFQWFRDTSRNGEESAGRIYGVFVGGFRAIVQIWGQLPAALGDLFVQAVNTAGGAIEALTNKAIGAVNSFAAGANKLLGVDLFGQINTVDIPEMENRFAGAAKKVSENFGKTFSTEVSKAVKEGTAAVSAIDKLLSDNITGAARNRVKGQADEIIASRTPKKGSDALGKALADLDAQIKGQWALAEAYKASDAEAMKAEARLKAMQAAISKKGDVEVFYEKELALAIATRAAEGSKAAAGMRAQAAAQKLVNDMVAAGKLDASQMGEALQFEGTLRLYVAAAAVAEGAKKLALLGIIKDLRRDQAGLNAETARGQALQAIAQNNNEVERLTLEATLIGASNRERATMLAQLEAEQKLRSMPGLSDTDKGKFVKSATDAAAATADLATAQDNYNASLTATLDLLSAIDAQAQSVAGVLSDAFGRVGDSVGGALTALSGYAAKQQDIADQREKQIKEAGGNATRLAQIEAQSAKRSAAAQIEAVGGVLSSAKSLFKQHSAGYQAMEAVERAYAVAQLARTVASIAPKVAAGAATMFSQLGVFAFPAVGAMIAVMAGLGFGGGGGSSSSAPSAEDLQASQGTGTVLGDPTAKSASIANSIEILARNSSKGLDHSAQMVRSLHKIETGIGALDGEVERQIGLIIGDLYSTVVEAARIIGLDVGDALRAFQVEIGKISLKDLKGDEITAALQSIFSKVADEMAGFAVAGVEQFQKAGEGLFETLTRLAKDYLTVDAVLSSVGLTFGAVGASSIGAREALLDLSGGLDQFVDSVSFYQQNFLTEAERTALAQVSVSGAMQSLGLASVTTIDQYKSVVSGLDLTSAAGQELFTSLMAVAPAFFEVASAADAVARARGQLTVQLLQAVGQAEEALTIQRALEMQVLDASLRPLQLQVWAAQDASKAMEDVARSTQAAAQSAEKAAQEASRIEADAIQRVDQAKSNLLTSYHRERDALEAVSSRFRSFGDDLRAFRDSLTVQSGAMSRSQALVSLMRVGGLAGAGNEQAMGQLPGTAREFLDISRAGASSLQQYQRDVALVAGYVGAGITAADKQVSNAERQMIALERQVGSLVDLNEGVLTVRQAIDQLRQAQSNQASAAEAAARARDEAAARERAAIQASLDKIVATNEATALSNASLEKALKGAIQGDAINVRNDSDTPVYTTAVP